MSYLTERNQTFYQHYPVVATLLANLVPLVKVEISLPVLIRFLASSPLHLNEVGRLLHINGCFFVSNLTQLNGRPHIYYYLNA